MSERDRLKLYEALGEVLGPDHAGTLMEFLPPTGWDQLATKELVAANATALRGEMAEVRGEMAEVRTEVAQLRTDMDAGFATLRADVTTAITRQGSELRAEMASLQRNLLLALAGFMLTIWLTLLFV